MERRNEFKTDGWRVTWKKKESTEVVSFEIVEPGPGWDLEDPREKFGNHRIVFYGEFDGYQFHLPWGRIAELAREIWGKEVRLVEPLPEREEASYMGGEIAVKFQLHLRGKIVSCWSVSWYED